MLETLTNWFTPERRKKLYKIVAAGNVAIIAVIGLLQSLQVLTDVSANQAIQAVGAIVAALSLILADKNVDVPPKA